MVQESGLFQRQDPVPGLGAAPQVADAAFQLADGAVSDALASPRGPVFIAVVGEEGSVRAAARGSEGSGPRRC